MDKGKAVTAAAYKFACDIYAMLTIGQNDADQGQRYCEERERVLRQMTKRPNELGFRLVPTEKAA